MSDTASYDSLRGGSGTPLGVLLIAGLQVLNAVFMLSVLPRALGLGTVTGAALVAFGAGYVAFVLLASYWLVTMRFRGWLATFGLNIVAGIGSLAGRSLLGALVAVVIVGYLVLVEGAFEEW